MRLAASAAGIPGTAEAARGSWVVDVVLDVEALRVIHDRLTSAAVEKPEAEPHHERRGAEDEQLGHQPPGLPDGGSPILVFPVAAARSAIFWVVAGE